MAPMSKEQLRELMECQEPGSVSIFLPTHRAGADVRQDPIRFKNLLREAQERLCEAGVSAGQAQKRLAQAATHTEDEGFWRYQSRGLSVFVNSQGTRIHQIPYEVDELVVISDRFHLKPLLPIISENLVFWLLAISERVNYLWRCDRYDSRAIELPGVPKSLNEYLEVYVDEEHLQFHSRVQAHTLGAPRAAQFHGQGTGTDKAWDKPYIGEYCHRVDEGVQKQLDRAHEARQPLVLAAAEPILSIYRHASHVKAIHPQAVLGNPDQVALKELHAKALEFVVPEFESRMQQAVDLFRQLNGTGRASSQVDTVLRAAHDSQIDTLFVARDRELWGQYDPDERTCDVRAERQTGDQDLLDLAAVRTFLSGGTVHAVARDRMPADSPLAATFRFPATG